MMQPNPGERGALGEMDSGVNEWSMGDRNSEYCSNDSDGKHEDGAGVAPAPLAAPVRGALMLGGVVRDTSKTGEPVNFVEKGSGDCRG